MHCRPSSFKEPSLDNRVGAANEFHEVLNPIGSSTSVSTPPKSLQQGYKTLGDALEEHQVKITIQATATVSTPPNPIYLVSHLFPNKLQYT